ncbi:hypothetical protein AALP_AA4G270400 [Arabis alpina]|uniref:Uncharacterized protein n=1 Tax=Arabis alpina TaxID=50452 RepID=A0A087H5Y9_ARAAL|nr:hypothetical protein AALP_AA4G270400 [Arabis alpina]
MGPGGPAGPGGPGGFGGPGGPGPGWGPGPGGPIGGLFAGFSDMICSCLSCLCCCWLLRDCFGGPPLQSPFLPPRY